VALEIRAGHDEAEVRPLARELARICEGMRNADAETALAGPGGAFSPSRSRALAYDLKASSEGISITGGHGIDPSSPQFQRAQHDCRSLSPVPWPHEVRPAAATRWVTEAPPLV
jgi:hypothetical protein